MEKRRNIICRPSIKMKMLPLPPMKEMINELILPSESGKGVSLIIPRISLGCPIYFLTIPIVTTSSKNMESRFCTILRSPSSLIIIMVTSYFIIK